MLTGTFDCTYYANELILTISLTALEGDVADDGRIRLRGQVRIGTPQDNGEVDDAWVCKWSVAVFYCWPIVCSLAVVLLLLSSSQHLQQCHICCFSHCRVVNILDIFYRFVLSALSTRSLSCSLALERKLMVSIFGRGSYDDQGQINSHNSLHFFFAGRCS